MGLKQSTWLVIKLTCLNAMNRFYTVGITWKIKENENVREGRGNDLMGYYGNRRKRIWKLLEKRRGCAYATIGIFFMDLSA